MAWQVVTPPTDEPFDLATIKAHCRIDTDADDALLQEVYLPAARDHLEYFTRRQWLPATLICALECLPWDGCVFLPRPPLQSVTSFKYYDTDNMLQTWNSSNYYVDTLSEPGRVVVANGVTWPSVYARPNAVQVTYVAGWATPARIPVGLRQALLLCIGHFYEHREEGVEKALSCLPWGIKQLAGMHRLEEV